MAVDSDLSFPEPPILSTVGSKVSSQHVCNGGSLTVNDVAAELDNSPLTVLVTAANTLCYRFWLLSNVEYANLEERLRKEVITINFEDYI